jgi:predicted DNA-binding protein (UPF0251 family)
MAKPLNPQTKEALRLMETEGITAYAASVRTGVKVSAISSARDRQRLKKLEADATVVCPTCGNKTLRR